MIIMEDNQFKIFHKESKFYLSTDKIFWYLFMILFTSPLIELMIFGEENISDFSSISMFLVVGLMFLIPILRLYKMNKCKRLGGIIDGILTFDFEEIKIDKLVVKLTDIKKIETSFHDYEGRKLGYSFYDFDGDLSNGVDNCLILHKNDGSQINTFFFQQIGNESKKIKKYLIHYHLQGKIHFLHLIDLLGITDYDEIQEFKKEIYSKANN